MMRNDRYEMEVAGSVLAVREVTRRQLVAYSCMNADFEQSLVEFVRDFFPERLPDLAAAAAQDDWPSEG